VIFRKVQQKNHTAEDGEEEKEEEEEEEDPARRLSSGLKWEPAAPRGANLLSQCPL